MTQLPTEIQSEDPPPEDAGPPCLGDRVPAGGSQDPDELLDLFLGWLAERGLELWPAQEEAILEVMAGRHVILNTPTGSGKSLVAVALHFQAFAAGRTSFYTSPIKALASEKFFALCQDFGPENVGMMTGDASINPEAKVLCCTAEVLSNRALRQPEEIDGADVVMDEFHYYSDPERGVAWQVPLIVLKQSRFLLMSATLGNPAPIKESLERQTGRECAVVTSDERPVPLDYEYRQSSLNETVEDLIATNKAPIYVVSFTQRECAELAQSLTSLKLTSKEEKKAIQQAIGEFAFDTAYGKEMRRFLSFGIGIHHAGLLPKYRLLVEQLSQQALLKVICGTDTLGVGVNIPLRTVLFRKLCKYDGTKVAILSVRDFKQISGRAGRKGFDDRGSVVCQAPEHVIENLKLDQKAAADPKKRKKMVKRKPPERGFVPWDEETFRRLIEKPPETLVSRFRMSHGMLLNLVQHDAELDDPDRNNFASLRELVRDCHETEATKQELIREAAVLVRSLHRANIVRMQRDRESGYYWVTVNDELQFDFSLFQSLSLFLVETLELFDPASETYALDVLSLTESVLENPDIVLRRQVDKIKDDLVARLKAEGVEYEQRMEQLEAVTHPKPNAELIYARFDAFRTAHPWVGGENIKPKGVGREIYEGYLSFEDFVRHYGLQRFEGILLRYLSQLFKTLTQTVPEQSKTDEVFDMLGFFRALLARVDTSLLEEWEALLDPESGLSRLAGTTAGAQALAAYELLEDPRAFKARVRAELHQLVRALAQRDYEEAALSLARPHEGRAADPDSVWDAERLEAAMVPFFEEFGELVFTPDARQAHLTTFTPISNGGFEVSQVLVDPEGENLWCLEGTAERPRRSDVDESGSSSSRLFRLRRIGV